MTFRCFILPLLLLVGGGAFAVGVGEFVRWSAQSEQESLAAEPFLNQPVLRFVTSDDGAIVAYVSHREIGVRNRASDEVLHRLSLPELLPFHLGMQQDQSIVATYHSGEVIHWRLEDGRYTPRVLNRFPGPSTSAVSANGRTAVVLEHTGRKLHLLVWSAGNWIESTVPVAVQMETATVGRVVKVAALSADGRLLAVAGMAGRFEVHDVSTGSLVGEFQSGTRAIRMLSFSDDSRLLAVGGWTGRLSVWDLQAGAPILDVKEKSAVRQVGFRRDNEVVAYALINKAEVCSRKLNDSKSPPTKLVAHSSMISDLAFQPDGALIVSGFDGVILHWVGPSR